MRGAVLFECAVYVNRIRSGWLPASLEVNTDGCKTVLSSLKQWGEAVGSKLEEMKDLAQNKMREEEEPVLPSNTSKGILVCILLF